MLRDFLFSVGSEKWSKALEKIESQLMEMPEENAKKYAAFSMALGHIAFADLDVSDRELSFLKDVLCADMEMKVSEALVVSQMATEEELWGSVDIEKVWAFINDNCDKNEKRNLLNTCFQLAAFDDIVPQEQKAITRMADAFDITHNEFTAISRNFRRFMQK